MKQRSYLNKFFNISLFTIVVTLLLGSGNVIGQTTFYTQGFETTNDWTLNDGVAISNNANWWVWSSTGGNVHGGSRALQIWDRWNGAWYADYDSYGNTVRNATKTFDFSSIPACSRLKFNYWVVCYGETGFDDLQVFVNNTLIDGPLSSISSWQQRTIDLSSYVGNNSVTIRFQWRNDNYTIGTPAARIDDISVVYSTPTNTGVLSKTDPLCLDNSGTITVTNTTSDIWYQDNYSSSTPQVGSYTLTENATINSGFMRLTPTTDDRSGKIIIDEHSRESVNSFTNTFKMYFGGGDGADGMSISYGNNVMNSYEYGTQQGLAISIDQHSSAYFNGSCTPGNNGNNNGVTAITLIYNNQYVACNRATNWTSTSWKDVYIHVDASNQLTMTINGTAIFTNQALPAAYSTDNKKYWKWIFAARTGSRNNQHAIDDVLIRTHRQYEYSLNNSTWQASNVFTGLSANTYNVYIREVNSVCSTNIGSITLSSISSPVGDPTLFGPNTWYVYAYNANTNYYDPPVTGVQYTNLDNTIISYAGWYTHNTLNIDSGTAWGPGGSPDDAPGYAGCPVTDDNHVFVYKRRGFPCGTYNISNISHDDAVNILVDGVSVHQTTACCGSNPNINIELGGNSTVEIRLGENQGSSYLAVNFVPVVNALAVNNDTKTCYVGANSGWNTFTIGNGRLLASIEPGASTLGNVEVTSYVSPSPFLVSACAPLYNPAHETAVLSRRWTITPATQPTNPVRVRLYFGEDEHSLLAPLSASSSSPDDLTAAYSDLRLSKYHHPSNTAVNSSFSDNCANIPAGQMTLWNPADANLISTLFTGFDANGRYTEYLINPPAFSEFWLHGSTTVSPLAITLASFSAKCNGSKVDIHWTTDAEFNSDYFTLERSRDGIIWDVVTTATATGSHNTATTYQATDIAASEVYYRLKETDLDGKSEYHGPIVVNCDNSSNELIVYPNPNKGTFTVAVNTSEAMGDAAILVQDVTGKTVASQTVHVFSGTNTVYFENANLIRGTYIVSILGKEKSTFTPVKLVIQ